VLRVTTAAWLLRPPAHNRFGIRAIRTLVANRRRRRSGRLRGRVTASPITPLRGRRDPTGPARRGARAVNL